MNIRSLGGILLRLWGSINILKNILNKPFTREVRYDEFWSLWWVLYLEEGMRMIYFCFTGLAKVKVITNRTFITSSNNRRSMTSITPWLAVDRIINICRLLVVTYLLNHLFSDFREYRSDSFFHQGLVFRLSICFLSCFSFLGSLLQFGSGLILHIFVKLFLRFNEELNCSLDGTTSILETFKIFSA